MSKDVSIPVEVDTRKARAELSQLGRDKTKTQKRISAAARRTSRMATRAFAFSGAAAAVGKFQNNEPSGNVDIYAEALTPYFAKWQQGLDRKLGYSAKARTSARERTKSVFAYTVGMTGKKAAMQDFFNTALKMQNDVESGRNIVRQDPRFLGVNPSEMLKTAVTGNMEVFLKNLFSTTGLGVLSRGINYIVEGIKAD